MPKLLKCSLVAACLLLAALRVQASGEAPTDFVNGLCKCVSVCVADAQSLCFFSKKQTRSSTCACGPACAAPSNMLPSLILMPPAGVIAVQQERSQQVSPSTYRIQVRSNIQLRGYSLHVRGALNVGTTNQTVLCVR